MSIIEPNEIIGTWDGPWELFGVLQASDVEGRENTLRDYFDFDGSLHGSASFAVEFRDADGKPIKFPVSLVSETRYMAR